MKRALRRFIQEVTKRVMITCGPIAVFARYQYPSWMYATAKGTSGKLFVGLAVVFQRVCLLGFSGVTWPTFLLFLFFLSFLHFSVFCGL